MDEWYRYCCLIYNYEFYYISVVTETMVIKQKQIIPMPPLEAPCAPLGGRAPQFKNHWSREIIFQNIITKDTSS